MFAVLNRNGVSGVAAALFVTAAAAGYGLTAWSGNRAPLFVGLLAGLYLLLSIKIANPWEKVAVLRLGRYAGLRGPGIFHVIPLIDTLSRYVDQRVRVTNVTAESTLTRDTVPVNVDAIVFWLVWNAEKSILEVEDFVQAIMMSAQTALRESIGRHELSADDYRTGVDGSRTAAHPGRKDQPMGHHRTIGRNPRRAHPASAGRRHVPPGPGGTRAPGPHHSGTGGNRDLREVLTGLAL